MYGGEEFRQNEQALSCRVMPDELASNFNLEEVDVGFNALTAMPPSWISGSAFGDHPPTQSSIGYIGMDSNAITVGLPFLDLPSSQSAAQNGRLPVVTMV